MDLGLLYSNFVMDDQEWGTGIISTKTPRKPLGLEQLNTHKHNVCGIAWNIHLIMTCYQKQ